MTTTTKPPALTRAQLHTLIAISRGHVSKPGPGIDYDTGTWRIDATERAVTTTVESLIAKGYARASTDVVDDRRKAEPTAAGTEAISREAHRAR